MKKLVAILSIGTIGALVAYSGVITSSQELVRWDFTSNGNPTISTAAGADLSADVATGRNVKSDAIRTATFASGLMVFTNWGESGSGSRLQVRFGLTPVDGYTVNIDSIELGVYISGGNLSAVYTGHFYSSWNTTAGNSTAWVFGTNGGFGGNNNMTGPTGSSFNSYTVRNSTLSGVSGLQSIGSNGIELAYQISEGEANSNTLTRFDYISITGTLVPEPATAGMLLIGLAGVALRRRAMKA